LYWHGIFSEIGVRHPPLRESTTECSISAIPMPPIMPPMWLRVVFGLTMRPAP
jgi:hypothetical protein